MTGLVIRLAPRERVLLNGAIIENGDKRTSLSIKTPNANVLRLRDAIHPDDAKTPVKRTCYLVQLILSGDGNADDLSRPLLRSIEHLTQVFQDSDSDRYLTQATEAVMAREYYQALKALRGLLPREARILSLRPN